MEPPPFPNQARYVQLAAPAKVNLCLHIRGRRGDGYHLLESLIVPVSLYDRVTVRFDPGYLAPDAHISVNSDSDLAPGGQSNLAYRAVESLMGAVRRRGRVTVQIRKKIPVGSGLGGGSSDAAAVLVGLNMLLDRPLSTPGLASLGARLGADVPVFVDGLPARVEGTGESVSPVRLPTQLALVLCSDRHVLSTKLVFSSLDVLSLTSGERPSNISNFIGGQLPAEGVLFNDLEEAAVRLHPDVSLLKNLLLDLGATGALMTGSGSAVFGIFCDPDQATEAATRLQAQGLWAAAVETLRCSPVVEV